LLNDTFVHPQRHIEINLRWVYVHMHGWWQGCAALGAPAYDPFGPEGANFNLLIGSEPKALTRPTCRTPRRY
jgi:hypothetical protein